MRKSVAREWVAEHEKKMIGESHLGKKAIGAITTARGAVKKYQVCSTKSTAKQLEVTFDLPVQDDTVCKYKLISTKCMVGGTSSIGNVQTIDADTPAPEPAANICQVFVRPELAQKIGESKAYRFPSPLDPIEVAWQKIVAGNLLQCGWCL